MTTSPRRSPDLPIGLSPNLKFVLGLSPSAMTLGLGNIRSLLGRLGFPERRFRSVVVAGTNGKGSVTAMLAAILTSQGLRVGRYTSPHVYSPVERVCIDGAEVEMKELENAAAQVAPLHGEVPFSYFEALTAIAFLVFAQRGVDIAVLETGLGGRFDATNVVQPEISVITSISLDHRRILGDSGEEILREKLGITRPGVPLLLGDLARPLEKIVREKAARDSFPVFTPRELAVFEIIGTEIDSTRICLKTELEDYGELALPFPGPHQVFNAVLAVGAAERIAGRLENLSAGLGGAYLPGRFERFDAGDKSFFLDVAHNDDALTAAVKMMARNSPREINALVLGLMRRKELFEFPGCIAPAAASVYLVSPDGGEAFTPNELLQKLFVNGLKDGDPDVILWERRSEEDDHWLRLLDHLEQPGNPLKNILVTGSHHVVEEFGKRLHSRNLGRETLSRR